MSHIIIGRPINGITLNGLEYLMDGNNPDEYMKFDSREEAEKFLLTEGYEEEDLEGFWIREYDFVNDKIIEKQ